MSCIFSLLASYHDVIYPVITPYQVGMEFMQVCTNDLLFFTIVTKKMNNAIYYGKT